MKSTMENTKYTGENMPNIQVQEKEKFPKTSKVTEIEWKKRMGTKTIMRTETRMGTAIKMDKKKEFTNDIMEFTRNIFLKT